MALTGWIHFSELSDFHNEAYGLAGRLLRGRMPAVFAVADVLVVAKSMDHEQLVPLLEGLVGPLPDFLAAVIPTAARCPRAPAGGAQDVTSRGERSCRPPDRRQPAPGARVTARPYTPRPYPDWLIRPMATVLEAEWRDGRVPSQDVGGGLERWLGP